MRDWNAGVKVLLAVGTLCMVILLDRISVSLFVIVTMGGLTLLIGRLPWKKYMKFMTIPLAFMIMSVLIIAIYFSRQPAGEWNISLHYFYLCMSEESVRTAVSVFLKALAGMSALYMMSLSTPVSEFILVLQKLHLPRIFTELMNLIYRYIFILLEAASQMQTAAKARMGYRNFRVSLRSFSGIAGNLFLISLKRANTYYDALVARGYDGRLEFLTEKKPVKVWQAAGCAAFF